MKREKEKSVEDRLTIVESELQQIKTMLQELLIQQAGDQPHPEEFMDINEAMKLLGMERHVLYAKCTRAEIPCIRVGKLYKFKRSEILNWLDRPKPVKNQAADDYVSKYLQKHVLRG